ncbi:MAG: hypothetical protein AAFP93_00615 [Bacteroidota bacterium]
MARVHDRYLHKSDVDEITKTAETPEERVKLAEQYIQTWVTKQLLIAEAERCNTLDQAEIEQKLSDYRDALLVHGYLERLVNDQLDTEVADQEIADYYRTHQGDFALSAPVFRGKWVIVPKEIAQKRLRQLLLQATDDAQLKALTSYCFQFAKEYSLDTHTWVDWESVLHGTPFQSVRNKTYLLARNKLLHRSDETYDYYIKIDAYKLPRAVAPLALVKNRIADIIVYKRKLALANIVKQKIVTNAKSNNHYTIYEY